MDESQTDDIPQVSDEENAHLTAPYSEDELKKGGFPNEHNKALARMVFQLEFLGHYQNGSTRHLELLLNFNEIILFAKVTEA
jgi:hypothetical protein